MAAVTVCIDFGAQEYEIWHCFHFFPIYLDNNHIYSSDECFICII